MKSFRNCESALVFLEQLKEYSLGQKIFES